MSRLDYSVYGSSVYGAGTIVPFIADPVTGASLPQGPLGVQCRVVADDTIDVFWVTPPQPELTMVRLVRSEVGPPAWEGDGDVLVDGPRSAVIRWTDEGLRPGTYYYYSVFAFDSTVQSWLRGGSTGAITPDSSFDMGDRLWHLVPEYYQHLDSQQQTYGDGPLKRFLQLLGFELDIERTEIESLAWVWDMTRGSAQIVPYALGQFLMEPEPELGYTNQRQLLRAAALLYGNKGSEVCVRTLCSTVTGWAAEVSSGVNLMVDNLDAQFDGGIGNWLVGANATVTYRAGDGTINAPNGIAVGVLKATNTSAPSALIYEDDPVYKGIPVTPGVAYGFSVLLRGSAGDPVQVQMKFWDVNGNLLSMATGSTVTPDPSDWNIHAVVTAVAPLNAWSATMTLSTTGTVSGHVTYFSSALFVALAGVGSAMPPYQSARDIRVAVLADQVNEIKNPKFAVNANSWFTNTRSPVLFNGAVLTAISSDEPPPVSSGTCAQLVCTTANQGAVTICDNVTGGRYYTASAWVKPVSGAGAHIAVWDASTSIIHVSPTATTVGVWTYVSVSFVTGDATTEADVGIIADAATSVKFGAVMLTQGGNDISYFDGSIASPTADYLWEAQADASRSHFYRQRTMRSYRFRELLPRFIVGQQTATLLFAQGNQTPVSSYTLYPSDSLYPSDTLFPG